jgi:nucleoid DNA-binding protein
MSVDIKNLMIRTTSVKVSINEAIVDKVAEFQFKSAHEAMLAGNQSVEISGFGKFVFNNNKAKKKLYSMEKTMRVLQAKLDDPNTSEKSLMFARNVLEDTKRLMESLKPMIKYD